LPDDTTVVARPITPAANATAAAIARNEWDEDLDGKDRSKIRQ
jgi:hypothetical protein